MWEQELLQQAQEQQPELVWELVRPRLRLVLVLVLREQRLRQLVLVRRQQEAVYGRKPGTRLRLSAERGLPGAQS